MITAVRGTSHPGRPPYLAHFALREPPFSPAPDRRFFYADPARQQCLDMLLHLAQYSEEWLLVAGESGVGKSTVLAEFLARADEHLRPCQIDGHQGADGGQLFLRIAQCFGLDVARSANANPLEALRQHLNARHADQVPTVVVDNAERLSDDALEVILRLADLEGDHSKLVRLVLFAPATLLGRLEGERFAGLSKPHVMELRALDENQVGLYLAHRLSIAGYEGANPFDAKAVRHVYKESGGLPSRINVAADEVLRRKMAAERPKHTGSRVRRVLIPVAALAAAGSLVFLIQEQWLGLFGSPLSADESLVATAPAAPQPAPAKVTHQPTATPPAPSMEPTPLAARPLVLREGEAVQVTCSPLGESGSRAPEPALVPTASLPPEKQEAPSAPAPIHPAGPAKPVSPAATAVPTPVPTRDPAAVAGPASPADKEAVVTPSTGKTTGSVAPAMQTSATAVTGKAKLETQGLSGLKWLHAQDPRRVTLQLLAAGQERTVKEFIEQHRLKGPHAVVTTKHGGAPLYLLVYESYATKQAAIAAAKDLPTGVRAWPRPFSELNDGPKPATASLPAAAPEIKDTAWLWSRDPNRVTVQLVGAENEQALWSHLGKERLPGPLAIVATKRQDKPWFVLVYGDFADHEAALKARAALPTRLRQGEPWLRDFAALHALLGPRKPSPP